MKDKIAMWSIYITSVILIGFSCMLAMVAGNEMEVAQEIEKKIDNLVNEKFEFQAVGVNLKLDKRLADANNRLIRLENNYLLGPKIIEEHKKFKQRR